MKKGTPAEASKTADKKALEKSVVVPKLNSTSVGSAAGSKTQPPIPQTSAIVPARDLLNDLAKEQEEKRQPPPPVKSLQELIEPLLNLKCSSHSIRSYDHICTNTKCTHTKEVVLCPKCMIQNESHIKSCKNSIQTLEVFIPSKLEELIGKQPEAHLQAIQKQVTQNETDLTNKLNKLRATIEADIKEIVGSVKTICEELRVSLFEEIDAFEAIQKKFHADSHNELNEHRTTILAEGGVASREIQTFLSTNFDIHNAYQLQNFMRDFRGKQTVFSSANPLLHFKEILTNSTHNIKSNPYYSFPRMQSLKQSIYKLLQNPLNASRSRAQQDTSLLNFTDLSSTPTLDEQAKLNVEKEQIHGSDKRSIVVSTSSDERNPKQIGLQEKANLLTDHKLAISSISTVNADTFVTCGNEGKLKIWGFTQNYILHFKNEIQLPQLSLQILYHKHSNLLYSATSKGEINAYRLPLNPEDNVEQVRTYTGHTRTVRNLSFLPDQFNTLLSLSYDKTIKAWNTAVINSSEQLSHHLSVNLPIDEDCKFMESNALYTLVGSVSGNVLVYAHRFDADVVNGSTKLVGLKFLQKLKCSKEKVTSIVLGQKNPHAAYIGCGNGTVCFVNLSKVSVNPNEEGEEENSAVVAAAMGSTPRDGENVGAYANQNAWMEFKLVGVHKDRISSLNLFEENFLLIMSWDGIANLLDLRTREVVSSTKYSLLNDEKKHSDGASAKIAVSDKAKNVFHIIVHGNDDKRVQVMHLQLNDSIQNKKSNSISKPSS